MMEGGMHTPLHENHIRLGGKMVEFGDWALPVQYSAILAEHKAVREACGLFDVSHMGEIVVKGKEAMAFLNYLCTNDLSSMAIGRCRYTPMCYESGGTVDDLIIYKRGEADYLVIVNASNCEKDFKWITSHARQGLSIENISDQTAQLALQGPLYRQVLERAGLTGQLPSMPYAFVDNATVAGTNCLISTTGYTGEPGVELYLRPEDAGNVFDALIGAGAVPCGLGARDTLRFEASMPLYGHELGEDITPLECGLKAFVKLDKPDFIGKAALIANPPARRRIGLELIGKGIAREHCKVFDASLAHVGETTSGGPAPTLSKNMAMALVSVDVSKEDDFLIEVRGRMLAAKRVKLPFYKSAH